MLKKIIHGTMIYALGDMIVVGTTGFLLLPVYTKYLSKIDYATYSIVMTNATLLIYLSHFGLVSAFSRLYFDYSRQNKTNEYISTLLILHTTYVMALFLVLYLFSEPIWRLISPQTSAIPFLFFAMGLAFFSFVPAMYSLLLRIQEKAYQFIAMQVATVALIVCSTLYSLVYLEGDIEVMLLYLVIANSLIWFISVGMISKYFIFSVNMEYVQKTLKFAWPIFLSYLAYFLLNKYGLIFLQHYETLEQISYYTFAQQISLILVIAGTAFGKVVQPMIYVQEKIDLQQLKKITLYYRFLLTFIALALIAGAGPIIELLGSSKYTDSKVVFSIFIIANYFYLFSQIESFVLMYYKRSLQIMYITAGGALSVIILGMIFIPIYGIIAGAFALLGGNFLIAMVNIYAAKKLIYKEN
ncbi:MAG: oligosaccharide flippase family protein [Pseudomonadota bacterium]